METACGQKVEIGCTWGDGPDVCVNINYKPEELKRWTKGFFPLDFTGDEAILIGSLLIKCGTQAKEMDDSYRRYCEDHKND